MYTSIILLDFDCHEREKETETTTGPSNEPIECNHILIEQFYQLSKIYH